jgi:phosphatidylglycerophosphatase C
MSVDAASEVVVFDFDGTLVRRDSFMDFAVRYCRSRPARLVLLCAVSPLAGVFALRSIAAGSSVLLWAMTVGTSTRCFLLALRAYATRTLPQHAHSSIFQELTRHLQAGRRVVIATGSVPSIVRGLLSARGLGRLPIVGTRLRSKWGGLIADTHCTGKTKVDELQSRFGIVEWSMVYTNSFADRALISRARHITLVCPSRRTLLSTQRLIDGAQVLRVLNPN